MKRMHEMHAVLIVKPDDPEVYNSLINDLFANVDEMLHHENQLEQNLDTLVISLEQMSAQRQRYKNLFDFSPDAYIITNQSGTIQEVNHAAAELLNVSIRFLINKPLTSYVQDIDQLNFLKQVTAMQQASKPSQWETRMLVRGRPQIDVLMVAEGIAILGSEERGEIRWLIRDISIQKRTETAEHEYFFRTTFERAAVGIAHIGPSGLWLRVNQKLCEISGYQEHELENMGVREIAHPDDAEALIDVFRQLINGETQSLTAEKRFIHKTGAVIWGNLTASAVHTQDGRFLYSILVFEDISQRKQVEIAEREQRTLANAIHDTAIALTSTLDFNEVIERIFVNIGRLVPHDAANLMLVNDQQEVYVVRAEGYIKSGLPQLKEALSTMRLPLASAEILRDMAQTRTTVLITDWQDKGMWSSLPGMDAIRSMLAVPILSRDQVIGFLKLHSLTPNFFTSRQAELLQAFALQAAIAIQNSRAIEQAKVLAAAHERQRLARDLHDEVTQTLFTANVMVESLPRVFQQQPGSVPKLLTQLAILTRGALAEMRTLLLELRPEQLPNIHLPTQLRQLVDAVKGRKRLEVHLEMDDGIQFPTDIQITFYRIAQEALNNIVKHSRASRVEISLLATEQQLLMQIIDNGVGFDIEQKRKTSMGVGMFSMSERADAIGAEFELVSRLKQGTTVQVLWRKSDE